MGSHTQTKEYQPPINYHRKLLYPDSIGLKALPPLDACVGFIHWSSTRMPALVFAPPARIIIAASCKPVVEEKHLGARGYRNRLPCQLAGTTAVPRFGGSAPPVGNASRKRLFEGTGRRHHKKAAEQSPAMQAWRAATSADDYGSPDDYGASNDYGSADDYGSPDDYGASNDYGSPHDYVAYNVVVGGAVVTYNVVVGGAVVIGGAVRAVSVVAPGTGGTVLLLLKQSNPRQGWIAPPLSADFTPPAQVMKAISSSSRSLGTRRR
ncbi:unnamed protein product [Phytophthora lilii]|uniref:Unnamed protein product n=1 Tax=Phytophthora lilii TaxID=2077276 RepID=A0A9W6TDC8_9STRA|nr:unnamed protein product [Phytophthora lilii]